MSKKNNNAGKWILGIGVVVGAVSLAVYASKKHDPHEPQFKILNTDFDTGKYSFSFDGKEHFMYLTSGEIQLPAANGFWLDVNRAADNMISFELYQGDKFIRVLATEIFSTDLI